MSEDQEFRQWVKRILGSEDTRLTITEAPATAPKEQAEDKQMRDAVKSIFQDDEGDTRLTLGDGTSKPYTSNR